MSPVHTSPVKPAYVRPLDFRDGRIHMGHGAGGRASAQLTSASCSSQPSITNGCARATTRPPFRSLRPGPASAW
ncbi:hypothetical protein QFZ91_005603 [Paraburkholderia sp. JPY419]